MKKVLSMLLILVASVTLQSQKVKRDSTGDKLPATQQFAIDSSAFYKSKLDSINTDINKTVTRIERKIEIIPHLVEKVVVWRSRPKISVSEIQTGPMLPGLPEPRIDTLVVKKKQRRTVIDKLLHRKK